MSEKPDIVMTVLGPVPASDLGITLMHEHIVVNLLREFRLDGLLNNLPLIIKELEIFRKAGGRTVVEATTPDMGRNAAALKYVSEMTGLHIIAGCCYYRHQYLDAEFIDRNDADALADYAVRDLTEGIDGTNIKAGIIGEIACDAWLTAQEERVFRAAARAHKRTGATITTHAARWPIGSKQLDLLAEEDVEPRRVIIGHCDTVASAAWQSSEEIKDYHEQLAGRGAWVEMDNILKSSEYELAIRVEYVVNLIEKGFIGRILLSHDIARRPTLTAYGGGGYAYILQEFVPRLQAAGVKDEKIRTILVDNPRRALTGEPS